MIRVMSGFAAIAIVFSLFLAASFAQANNKTEFPTRNDGKRIFQCLINFGEFQEVSVYSMSNGTFKMTTLNKAGSAQAYEMPSNEWSNGKLNVPCSHDEKKTCGEIFINGRSSSYDFGSSIGDCN